MNVNLKQDIKPISYIKTNAAEMMQYINTSKNPIIVTQNGEARGVLVDIESYQNMVNAMAMMKLLQYSEKDIENKKVFNNDEVFDQIKKKHGKIANAK
jgi:prevent-host-death family protein